MRGLDDVEAVGACVQREQQDIDVVLVLEGAQVLLGTRYIWQETLQSAVVSVRIFICNRPKEFCH